MQTRSSSKAFRNTICRMWWVPFLSAAIVAPALYTMNEIGIEDERFVSSGKILLAVPDGSVPEQSVIAEHEFMLQSSVRKQKAKDILVRLRPEAAFMEDSIKAVHVKDTGIIAVSCHGTDAELVRELLRLQVQLYMEVIASLHKTSTPESVALDLANVTPQVLEWPGPSVETKGFGAPSWLYALSLGGGAGIACMLFISGVWAFFRPARIQPSLEEIMKAADGLEPNGRVVLLERLVEERDSGK